jgi:hypothetical protein
MDSIQNGSIFIHKNLDSSTLIIPLLCLLVDVVDVLPLVSLNVDQLGRKGSQDGSSLARLPVDVAFLRRTHMQPDCCPV